MALAFIITVLGFILAVIILLFTGQGEEIKENIKYWLRMFVKKIKVSKRGHTDIQQSLVLGDKSKFICDVTIPDGTIVKVNQKFTKIWEIQNVGSIIWDNRYLQREGPCEGPKRLKSRNRVRIPYTAPGQRVKIKVSFIVPSVPGSYYCEWKMVDEKGNYLLPNQKPIAVFVDVVY